MVVLFFVGVAVWAVGMFFSWLENRGKNSRKEWEGRLSIERNERHNEKVQLQQEITVLETRRGELESRLNVVQSIVDQTLQDWRQHGAMLPSLREWSDKVRAEYDAQIVSYLKNKSHPAIRASEEVKKALAKARESKKEAERLSAQLAVYESQAPWLAEFTDCTVEEIIEGIKEEEELRDLYSSGDDPVALFVPKTEWTKLSVSERNQRALDRYWTGSRRRTAWTAGIQYERFIGYQYESTGFEVEYHGAKLGKSDLGIDLVCNKGSKTHIVQCKRLSEKKGIPVR